MPFAPSLSLNATAPHSTGNISAIAPLSVAVDALLGKDAAVLHRTLGVPDLVG
jgi:hypothetical protein